MTVYAVTRFNFPTPKKSSTPPPSLLSKSLNGCRAVASGVGSCAGKLLSGIKYGTLSLPLDILAGMCAEKIGVLPSGPELTASTCPASAFSITCSSQDAPILQELQGNQAFIDAISEQMHRVITKKDLFKLCVIWAPVSEELLCRGLIQDVLLQRLPSYLLKKTLPGKDTLLQSRVYQIARVVLAAALFSGAHLIWKGAVPDTTALAQAITSIFSSVVFGAIKESSLGILGSIGAHAIQNLIALSPVLLSKT